MVVRDLALALKRQGHQPLVFSPKLGAISREIRSQDIEVTSDLTKLDSVPDIIHGHHHPQTAEALAHFPTVPAVWVCHSGDSRLDGPFYFPRILRYVAVDDLCRKRVESASRMPPSRIEVIWNAVDLERFTQRAALPAKPRRALVFSNYADNSTHLPAVRRACKRAGVNLDVVGHGMGTGTANPELVLPRYDIVFAKAR